MKEVKELEEYGLEELEEMVIWEFVLEDVGVSLFPDRFDDDLAVGNEVYDSDSNKGYKVTKIEDNVVYLKEMY